MRRKLQKRRPRRRSSQEDGLEEAASTDIHYSDA